MSFSINKKETEEINNYNNNKLEWEFKCLKADILKLKESKTGVMSFFSSSKKNVKEYCFYKNFIFMAVSDSTILVYDSTKQTGIYEIRDIIDLNLSIYNIEILYETSNYNFNDLLLCLCDYKVFIYDANSYKILKTIDFKFTPFKCLIDYQDNYIQMILLNKKGFILYEIDNKFNEIIKQLDNEKTSLFNNTLDMSKNLNKKSSNGFNKINNSNYSESSKEKSVNNIKLNKLLEIEDIDNFNKFCLFKKNFLFVDTKNKLLIYKFKVYEESKINKLSILINIAVSKDSFYNFKHELESLKFNNDNKINTNIKLISLSKKDSNLYKPDSKYSDIKYNQIFTFIDYSYITNKIYLGIINKIVIVKNNFSEFAGEDFEIIDKISKGGIITNMTISDPYMFIQLDKKIYVYFITSLDKSIDSIQIDDLSYYLKNKHNSILSNNQYKSYNSKFEFKNISNSTSSYYDCYLNISNTFYNNNYSSYNSLSNNIIFKLVNDNSLLFNINRVDLSVSIINYNDEFLMSSLLNSANDNIENNSYLFCSYKQILFFHNVHNLTINCFYFKHLDKQFNLFNCMNNENYYCILLSYYLKVCNLKYYSYYIYDEYIDYLNEINNFANFFNLNSYIMLNYQENLVNTSNNSSILNNIGFEYYNNIMFIDTTENWLNSAYKKTSYYNKLLYNNDTIRQIDKKYIQTTKSNRTYILNLSIEYLISLINKSNFKQARMFLDSSTIDIFYIFNHFRGYLHSNCLNLILNKIYNLIYYDYKETLLINENNKTNEASSNKEFVNDKASIKYFSYFIKFFMNKIIQVRNNIKRILNKEIRKQIDYDLLQKDLLDKNINNVPTNKYNNYNLKNIMLLKFVFLENLIFIMNIYSYKLTSSKKFKDSLFLIIKQSNHIIDYKLINLLEEFKLKEEVLILLFHKRFYSDSVKIIIKYYNKDKEEINKNKQFYYNKVNYESNELNNNSNNNSNIYYKNQELEEKILNYEDDRKHIYNLLNKINYTRVISEEDNNNDNNNNLALNKNNSKLLSDELLNIWFFRYINLLSILYNKISNFEFYEYLKWPLNINSHLTLNLLYYKKCLTITDKVDCELLNVLKSVGIDSVIDYFEIYLTINSEYKNPNINDYRKLSDENYIDHIDQIISLYASKISIILEEIIQVKNIENNKTNYYNKILYKTRLKFLSLLVKYNNYDKNFPLNEIEKINIEFNYQLDLEKGIVFIKKKLYDEGIKLMFKDKNIGLDDIISDFCYYINDFDLINLILKYIEINQNSNNQILNKDSFIINLLDIIKKTNNYDLLENLIKSDYLDNLNNCVVDNNNQDKNENNFMLDYLIDTFSNINNNINSLKIQNSMSQTKTLLLHKDINEFRIQQISPEYFEYCKICQKGFFDCNFLYIDNAVYHVDCYNNIGTRKSSNY